MALIYGWHDLAGMAGVGLIVVSYWLLQSGRWASTRPAYSAANAAGAALILVSLSVEFNLAAFTIEVFWLAISGYGLWRTLRRPVPDSGSQTPM
jgi:hypothetical protein